MNYAGLFSPILQSGNILFRQGYFSPILLLLAQYLSEVMSDKMGDFQPLSRTLTETDISTTYRLPTQQNTLSEPSLKKKRIGPYSYYLNEVIGSGFSSTVYKGIKDNNKQNYFAIKVVKLSQMSATRKSLLENEIQILKTIKHSSLLQFYDCLYTHNNCYIVTEFCEGGTLENYLPINSKSQIAKIVFEIGKASQYLSERGIVHRDIKPANILLKGTSWKLGDFGFAIALPFLDAVLVQNYTIGSPLYMPLQTLSSNQYSSKTDSFALGMLIYFLMQGKYPWHCRSKNQLIKGYKTGKFNANNLTYPKGKIGSIVKRLLSVNRPDRLDIKDIDFRVFLREEGNQRLVQGLSSLANKFSEQLTLCQFIHYLMNNLVSFMDSNQFLLHMLANWLYQLTNFFCWDSSQYLSELRCHYFLPLSDIVFQIEEYEYLQRVLMEVVTMLKEREEPQCRVGLEKLLQLELVVSKLTQGQIQQLGPAISSLVLHTQFQHLRPNQEIISQLLNRL